MIETCFLRRFVAVWAVTLLLGATSPLQASGNCDPDKLTADIEACGIDLDCMTRVSAEFEARCGQGSPEPPPPGGGGGGGMGGFGGMGGMNAELMQKMMECGSDQACYERVMNEMMNQGAPPQPPTGPGRPPGGGPSLVDAWDPEAPDTTPRISESTMIPASWLQWHQEGYVSCGKNVACWGAEQARGMAKVRQVCGTNMFNEWTITCTIAAQYETHIEQAIAMQRLWRKGIRFEGDGPGGGQPGATPTPPGTTPPAPTRPPAPEGETTESWDFLRTVTAQKVRSILDRWDGNMRGAVPNEVRLKLKTAADQHPLEAEEGKPPFYFEEVDGPDGVTVQTRASRRDHAYALAGVLLTQAGMVETGEKGRIARDAAFWCAIQAAKLKLEPDHLANVGFHLNLRAKLQDAGDVLTYAHQQDRDHADVNNNLAFSESGQGRKENARKLQRHANRMDPESGHIRSRLDAMEPGRGTKPKGVDPNAPMPHGGDFGEAYFRLGKRHQLREYWANKTWQKARDRTKAMAYGGGSKPINGPWEVYQNRLKAIDEELSKCGARAPKILMACPLPGYDPRCKGAPSQAEVRASQQAHARFMCQCKAVGLQSQADALSALVDEQLDVWKNHSKKWAPRLASYVEHWGPDIQAVNARYEGSKFRYPVEGAYTQWQEEFKEDADDFWNEVQDAHEKWGSLKSSVQSLKACPPPPIWPPKKPKRPPPPKPKKVKKYEVNLGPIKFSLDMSGNFDFEADFGVVKLAYGYRPGQKGHKFTVGSGPVDFSYQYNGAPGPGGSRHKVTATASANLFKFVPGAGKYAAGAMDQIFSLGGKYQMDWSSNGGFTGKPIFESKSKWGFNSSSVPVRPGRTLN